MKNLSLVDLSGAEYAVGISQAPNFLMRKLQSDRTVQELCKNFSERVILSELRKSLERKPKNLRSVAKSYSYLVALFFSPDSRYLEAASKLNAPYLVWYEQIAQKLLATYAPVSWTSLQIPQTSLTQISEA